MQSSSCRGGQKSWLWYPRLSYSNLWQIYRSLAQSALVHHGIGPRHPDIFLGNMPSAALWLS